MNSILKWQLLPEEIFGDSFICGKHKVLNNFVGLPALIGTNVFYLAVFIYGNFRLVKVEVDGAPCHSIFTKDVGKFFHQAKHWNKVFIFFRGGSVSIFNNGGNICVTHALIHINNRFRNGVVDDAPLGIHLHNARKRQTVNAGVKGTNAI